MNHYCKTGDIVRYIRTEAVYLLLREIELSDLATKYTKEGQGFLAIVIYTGRSYTKQGSQIKIFIPFAADYYTVLSPASAAHRAALPEK